MDYYRSILSGVHFAQLSVEEDLALTNPFTMEEIKGAV